jgi:chromate transport protein ChrA
VGGAAVMGMLAGSIAFGLGHRRVLREAEAPAEVTVRMASLVTEDDQHGWWVGFVDWLAMLGPPAVPVATLVFLAVHWQQHSSFFSRTDGLFMAVYGLVLGLCFGTANQWALRFRARSSDWAPTAAASHKYRTYLGAMLAFTFGYLTWGLCSTVVMSYKDTAQWLRPFQMPYQVQMPMAFLFPLCVGAMAWWLRKHLATESRDPMADKYWKWGYFYFNPEDSALVVPTRSGIGLSHNYARPGVWWVAGAVVVVTIASFVQIASMTRSEERESQRVEREIVRRPSCEGCVRVEH